MKKKEKLELMLNKVVEYNNPKKGLHFKAFLYKGNGFYYFKIVEIITGDLNFNNIIHLKDGDENFLIIAEKPKLMRVSKKSWHYKLLQYVLRDSAPTPKDMQNGCPYFWLLIFSLFVVPFILLAKGIYWTVMLIPKGVFIVLEQLVNTWVAGLDEAAAYDMYYRASYDKIPKTAKIYFNQSDDNFFDFFLSKKYKDFSTSDPDYNEKYEEKRKEIAEKWKIWRIELDKERDKKYKLKQERDSEKYTKRHEQQLKRRQSQEKWDAKMQPFRTWRANTASWFKNTFTVQRGRRNMIVKRTKQFMGALVTLIVLAGTFFAVNYISLGLMWLADLCIANWEIFAGIGVFAIIVGILYLLYVLITSWGQTIINKYNGGRKIWYVEPFIYVVWYPLKYVAIAFAFLVVKVLWIPIKFIFYTCLWQGLVIVAKFIWGLIVNLVKGIAGSTGIFGEYFGASYSDYCPGIEWCDFEDED